MKTVVIFLFIFGICPVFVRYLLGILVAYSAMFGVFDNNEINNLYAHCVLKDFSNRRAAHITYALI